MPESTPSGQQRVALYVRADLPAPTQNYLASISSQLERLVAAGTLSSYSTITWEKRLPTSTTDSSQHERFAQFRAWADRSGVDLSPGFGTRRCYSKQTAERSAWRVYPAICLAVYEGEELVGVYPHQGDEPQSVLDGLSELDSAIERPHSKQVSTSASD